MSNKVKFIIDGKECTAEKGMMLVDAAAENGVYIPVLCHMKGMIPAGSCRVCTCKINGRNMAGCTTPVDEGMKIENDTPELTELRKTIVEVLFVEGNHFCPACEKSGNCELQALGYKYQMMVPRFPYSFPPKAVEAGAGKIYLDRNRCIMCKKCIRTVHVDGKNVFAFRGRGAHLEINIDKTLAAKLTDKQAQEAMDVCPVGSILRKEKGFDEPIGTRKYDKHQIGSEIEKVS
ncbi:MAG: NADP oxidoreductase [Bacteroidetes bacterium GWF2_38_335]|nr:MAG: NADP oxidoreductase [Bacteroidetes bacterium GWF2_38_335]HBS88243.1 NADP oxidoreductase [Bacteroidales bacterium]